ncbi:Endonuclease 8-like 3 [Bienertia sinuspersici]
MIERKNKTICGHGVPAIVSTMKKNNDNHGRRFYGCPYWQEDDCEFFEWIDKEQYEPRANYVIVIWFLQMRDWRRKWLN